MQVLRAQALVNTGLIAPELCPVSLLQESLWRQDQAGAAGARDRILRAFRLRGELRREPFCEALRRAVDSHPPLRTRFHFREQIRSYGASTIVQVIAPEGEFALDTVSGDPMEILAREREHRFDLARGPLIRAVLVRTGDDEHVLICNVHRIIADEKSVDILLAESSDFYAALLDGESPKPVERPSYADFAVARDDLPVERQIEFWKNHLSGPLPAIELPADHRRGLANHHHVSMHEFALPSGIEQATALAGLMVLLGRYTGAEEVLIGVCSDRRTAPFSVTFGPFENTLLLKMDLTGDLDVRESFDRAAAVLADASAAGDVPLGKVVDLNPGTAPFQVEFDWRDEPPSKFALRGLEV